MTSLPAPSPGSDPVSPGRPLPAGVRRAPDLAPEERDVAAFFEHLTPARPPATLPPESLRAAVLAASALPVRLLRFPLGAWGLASAALLLLALGAALTVELAFPPGGARDPLPEARDGSLARVVIVEDPTMALFHDVETFDEVGLPPGEVIADWGR